MESFRPYAIYIIIEDGRCAYFKPFSDNAPPPDLVSALLTAMQGFVKEVTGSHFTELTAGPFSFTSERVGPFSVVIVSNKSEIAIEKAKYLSLRFIKRFRMDIENWSGNTIDFETFDEDIQEIIGKVDTIRIDPSVPLDAISLLSLRPQLQSVSKALLTKGALTLPQVIELTGISPIQAENQLEELLLMGHVGKYKKEGQLYYFVV